MTHKNLVLTEEAIKSHCKRLKKLLKDYNQDLSLSEVHNLFSKSLGFNNFHELKKVITPKVFENNEIFIVDKIIPQCYKQNEIANKKNNMLEYVLLIDKEIVKHKIPESFTQLVYLVITSTLEEVKIFIQNNDVDINYQVPGRNWQPKNILDFAIFFEQYEILKYLISLKDINLHISEEYLLTIEAQRNNIDMFKYLCSVLPYTQNTLNTALIYASSKNVKIVKYLLTNKQLTFNANIHFRNDSCLKFAIQNGNLNIVKYLLTSEDLKDKPSLYSKYDDNIKRDIRNVIIDEIKLYSGQLKDHSGTIIDTYSQTEKDNFFSVLNYLIKDYADSKFLSWLYIKKELRIYIDKNKIDIDSLFNFIE